MGRENRSQISLEPDSAVILPGTVPLDSRKRGDITSGSPSVVPLPLSIPFRLSLPVDYLSHLPEGYEFELIRRVEPKMSEENIPGESGSHSDFNPRRYLGGGLGTPASSTPSFRRSVLPRLSTVFSAVRSEILLPWAGRVVEKIQMNWTLPAPKSDLLGMTVLIALELGSGDQIRACHILDPSLSPELDRSALEAVRLSFPLPELPSDFPNEPLSVILVFSVHE